MAIRIHHVQQRQAGHPDRPTARPVSRAPARGEIGVVRVHARVVDRHQHIRAVQVQIVGRGQRVHRDAQRHPRQVIRGHPRMGRLGKLHHRRLHQGGPVGGRQHPHHGAEGRLVMPNDLGPQCHELSFARCRIGREDPQRERRPGGQRLFLHRQPEQRGLQLVIRLVRQHRLHQRTARQLAGSARRHLHQISIVGNIGNHFRARRQQRAAKPRVNRAAGLHNVRPRIGGTQMGGNVQIQRLVGVNEGIRQQNRVGLGLQLANRISGVRQAVRELVGVQRGNLGRRRGRAAAGVGGGRALGGAGRDGGTSASGHGRALASMVLRPKQPHACHGQQAQHRHYQQSTIHNSHSKITIKALSNIYSTTLGLATLLRVTDPRSVGSHPHYLPFVIPLPASTFYPLSSPLALLGRQHIITLHHRVRL